MKRSRTVGRFGATGLVLTLGVVAGGCSTDFRRLEQPSLGLNERSPLPTATLNTRRNAGGPAVVQETWQDSGARAPLPPVTSNPRPAFDNSPPPSSTAGLSKPFDRPKPAVAAAPTAGVKIPVPLGESIEVQAGDSLYAISRRHNVSIATLMDVNQLKSPNLKPGQKLVLPSNARRPATKVASAGSAIPPSAVVSAQPVQPSMPAPAAAPSQASADWSGSYTLKSGDSLYAIARSHKVQLAELQRVNNIADATKVRPGTVLKVPAAGGSAGVVAAATPAIVPASPEAPRATQIAVGASTPSSAAAPVSGVIAPKIINAAPAAPKTEAETQVATVAPTPPPAAAAKSEPAVASGVKFRWPVKGQIVTNFGKRPDGSPNDGVSIGVPVGTDVHAAQDGTIAYAGSELKGYGNLILVRHDGGWVTAYAHSSEILVKRGDTVKRGQVIAKSGQTGGVDKPVVHFELRKDSKPLDPAPHMEKM